jgi:hypothetical protein
MLGKVDHNVHSSYSFLHLTKININIALLFRSFHRREGMEFDIVSLALSTLTVV